MKSFINRRVIPCLLIACLFVSMVSMAFATERDAVQIDNQDEWEETFGQAADNAYTVGDDTNAIAPLQLEMGEDGSIQVSTWDEFIEAVGNAAENEIVIDLVDDIPTVAYTINAANKITITSSNNKTLFLGGRLTVNSNLVLKDLTIKATVNNYVYITTAAGSTNKPTVDIYNTTFDGDSIADYILAVNSGTANIYSVTVKNCNKYFIYNGKNGTVNFFPIDSIISGSYHTTGTTNIVVNSGTAKVSYNLGSATAEQTTHIVTSDAPLQLAATTTSSYYYNLSITPNEDSGDPPPDIDAPAGGSIPATSENNYDVVWDYGGTVERNGSTLSITANSGYVVDEIWVDGKVDTSKRGQSSCSLTLESTPTHSVAVHFAYTLTVNPPDPLTGSLTVKRDGVTLTSGSIVRAGDTLTITTTPQTAYELDGLKLTGFNTSNPTVDKTGGTCTVTVTAGHGAVTPRVEASFKTAEAEKPPTPTGYTITPKFVCDGVEVNPPGTMTFTSNGKEVDANQAPSGLIGLTITPPAGYDVVSVSFSGSGMWYIGGRPTFDMTVDYTAGMTFLLSSGNATITAELKKGADDRTIYQLLGTDCAFQALYQLVSQGGTWEDVTEVPYNDGNTRIRVSYTGSTPSGQVLSGFNVYYASGEKNGQLYETTAVGGMFYMPAADVRIEPVFKVFKMDLYFSATLKNASTQLWVNDQPVTAGSELVVPGDKVSFTITPDERYKIVTEPTASINLVNSPAIEAPAYDEATGRWTFTIPSYQTTQSAAVYIYTATAFEWWPTAVQSAGGTVTAEVEEEFGNTYWRNLKVTAVPDENYRIMSISISYDEGQTWTVVTNASTYLGTQITGDVWVKAEFAPLSDIIISTEEELRDFAQKVNNGDGYQGVTITLANDIELSDDWTPIGTSDNPFRGTFNGDTHTISGLDITWSKPTSSNKYVYLGLFGYIANAEIRDLTVDGTIILNSDADNASSGDIYVGPITAFAVGNCRFIRCASEVDMTTAVKRTAGGLVGTIQYDITFQEVQNVVMEDCINNGSHANNSATGGDIGGLVGYIYTNQWLNVTIKNCGNYSDLPVEGGKFTFVDSNTGSTVHDGTGCYVGGLVGRIDCTGATAAAKITVLISNCLNKGDIVGDMYEAGGFVSEIRSAYASVILENCYNTGNVIQDGDCGISYDVWVAGMVAYFRGTEKVQLKNCYSTGTAALTGDKTSKYGAEARAFDLFRKDTSQDSPTLSSGSKVGAAFCNWSNCFNKDEILLAANQSKLLTAGYMEDTGINGGLPILPWEKASDETYFVTFRITPADITPTVTVFSDAARTKVIAPGENGYELRGGGATYYYRVTGENCVTEEGNFTVKWENLVVEVELKQAAEIIFQVFPSETELTVSGPSGEVKPDNLDQQQTIKDGEKEYAVYTYNLYTGMTYTYDAYAKGYNGYTDAYTPEGNDTIKIELTKAATGNVIYGDRNEFDEDGNEAIHEITKGGNYVIGRGGGPNGEGIITISTNEAVTLAGEGVGNNNKYEDLYINCTGSSTNLTLKDVYISNHAGDDDDKMTNMVNFKAGSSNTLNFSGISILDQDTDATGYAMIHVAPSVSLNITGGTVYMYKNEQGAAIGGNGGAKGSEGEAPEANGNITINGATLYAKGNKQGAVIGSGSGASRAGNISISNSNLYLIAYARGAAIGGAAGSGGATPGGNVSVSNSNITINVEWSGAAIGGGGYDGGNDAIGGTLNYSSGSIRTYIGTNAAGYWSWAGVSTAGVNGNKAITANVTGSGGKLYLLEFDTNLLTKSASSFTVKTADGKTIYNGGLHRYAYVNADIGKAAVQYTMDNWSSLKDPNLYLYLTGKTQEITVNSQKFIAEWDEDAKTFTVEAVEAAALATTVIEDGLAITTIDSAALVETLKGLSAGTTLTITAEIPKGESVYGSKMVMTREDVQNMANAGVLLKTESPIADITLTNAGLKDIASRSGNEVVISAITENEGIHIGVSIDGKELDKINGGLTVTLPIPDPSLDVVLVMVNADGSETIVKDAVIGRTSITATVDGSCILKIVEKPSVTLKTSTVIKDGIAITTVDSDALAKTLKTVEPNTQLVITPDIPNNANIHGTTAVMTREDVRNMTDAGVSLKVESPIADITLSNAALGSVAGHPGNEVTISAIQEADGIHIEVALDGVALTKITDGLRVTIPLDKKSTANTRLVLVNADGTETIIEDAVVGAYSITAVVDGSCILKVVERLKEVALKVTTVIENGKAITTIDSASLLEVLKEADSGTQIVIDADIPEGVEIHEAVTLLTRGDVRAIAESEASLKIGSPLADIVLSNTALKSIAGAKTEDDSDEVAFDAALTKNGTYIGVLVNGKAMSKVEGGLLVRLPAANPTSGTVMVLVDEYGNETVIKKSVAGMDTVSAYLSGSCTVRVLDNAKSFGDVISSAWYADAVAFATGHELFNGISETKFDPTGLMTRSMLVTVLHRLEDTPAAAQASQFSDVLAGTWYTDAVAWASANGIVEGTGSGFNPDGSVTREQIATILYRYMQYLGLDVLNRGVIETYSDGGQTSNWAYEAMQWAVGAGIIQGKSTTVLDPSGNASRAEVATMLQRLINLMVE